MATERLFKIAKFAGLNESEDGENNLEINEASRMVNCKVTKEKNLKKRPGTKTWIDVSSAPIKGLWYGLINGVHYLLCATNNSIYSLDVVNKTSTRLGSINTEGRVNFFGFQNMVYIQDGHNYKQYDGTSLLNVVGYIPTVLTGCSPATGSGTELEEANKLNATRRAKYSPDGTATTFQILEHPLARVDYVKDTNTGTKYPEDAYAVNLTAGTITFDGSATETFKATSSKRSFVLQNPDITSITSVVLAGTTLTETTHYTYTASTNVLALTDAAGNGTLVVTEATGTAPASGTNSLEICYTVKSDYRNQVCSMTNAEIFSGGTDAVVCIYGDGSNEFFYSSVDENGTPRADYFPDLNEAAVGSSNSEITQLFRHQSRMIAYKPNEAYSISFGTTTLSSGLLKFTYTLTPINREKGNEAKGMVQLVDNAPRTLWDGGCYYWVNSSYYSSNLTADERQARICSDKVHETLSSFDFSNCITYDDNREHEYWIVYGDKALVECYEKGVEAWYYYEGLEITSFVRIGDYLYLGTADGKLKRFSSEYSDDDGEAFSVEYETGAIDFGRPDYFKFINKIFVSIKPQGRGKVYLGVSTDKKIASQKKAVTSNILDFAAITFGPKDETPTESNSWTFETNDMPKTKRLKIKAKKFTYWKALISLESADESFTITNIAVPVRFTGQAK